MVYDNLTAYERSLARFGDKCALIAGLEISEKLSPEDAYQQIRILFKDLKKLRKKERRIWGNTGIGTTKVQ
jgi:hypothetical protein